MALPWAMALDVSYVGQHQYNILQNMDINRVDFGTAFLPENQDRTLAASTTPGATAVVADLMRAFRGYSSITQTIGLAGADLSLDCSCRSSGGSGTASRSASTTRSASTIARTRRRACSTTPDGTVSIRCGPGRGRRAARQQQPAGPHHEGELRLGSAGRARQFGAASRPSASSRTTGSSPASGPPRPGSAYAVGYSYQNGGGNVNLTGSPDYGGAHPDRRRPRQRLQRRRLPPVQRGGVPGAAGRRVGLESGNDYLKGCFQSALDLSLQRTISLGGGRDDSAARRHVQRASTRRGSPDATPRSTSSTRAIP